MSVILTKRNIAAVAKDSGRRRGPVAAGTFTGTGEVTPVPDDALTRILKMIPGEATALYTAAIALDPTSLALPLVAFFASALVVVLVVRRSGKLHTPPVTPEPLQYVFQLLAFVAWSLAIHSPIAAFVTLPSWVAPLAILCIPVIGGLVLRDDTAEPVTQNTGGATE